MVLTVFTDDDDDKRDWKNILKTLYYFLANLGSHICPQRYA